MTTRELAFLSLLLAATPAVGDVYRSVDENGNIIYSDTPSPNAEKIQVQELQTIPGLAPASSGGGNDEGDGEGSAPVEFKYEGVAISSPADDEALRGDGDTLAIPVSVSVKPALNTGDTVVLYLDGKEYAIGTGNSFTLNGVERGTHQLRAAVRDPNGKILDSSPTTTFHLLLHSKLNPVPTVGKPPAKPK